MRSAASGSPLSSARNRSRCGVRGAPRARPKVLRLMAGEGAPAARKWPSSGVCVAGSGRADPGDASTCTFCSGSSLTLRAGGQAERAWRPRGWLSREGGEQGQPSHRRPRGVVRTWGPCLGSSPASTSAGCLPKVEGGTQEGRPQSLGRSGHCVGRLSGVFVPVQVLLGGRQVLVHVIHR